MAFYHRIPTGYLRYVPAVYFAAIGAMDVGSDAYHHILTADHIAFNLILFAPLLIPHRFTYLIFGTLYAAFSCYMFVAIFFFFIKYTMGTDMRHTVDTFVLGPLFSALCLLGGLSLIHAGMRLSQAAAGKAQ